MLDGTRSPQRPQQIMKGVIGLLFRQTAGLQLMGEPVVAGIETCVLLGRERPSLADGHFFQRGEYRNWPRISLVVGSRDPPHPCVGESGQSLHWPATQGMNRREPANPQTPGEGTDGDTPSWQQHALADQATQLEIRQSPPPVTELPRRVSWRAPRPHPRPNVSCDALPPNQPLACFHWREYYIQFPCLSRGWSDWSQVAPESL